MKKQWLWFSTILGILMIICLGIVQPSLSKAGRAGSISPERPSSAYDRTDQIIVKYRNPSFVRSAASNVSNAGSMINTHVNNLSAMAGVQLTHFRFMSGDGHVLKFPNTMTLAEAESIAQMLNNDPSVEYAEPDRRMFPMLTPNDPQYANQWHYKAPVDEIGGANLPGAWAITTGSSGIVVADIDTGIRFDHADLVGRTVPGYNFISDSRIANNATGRSADASDLGDWITSAESASGFFAGCTVGNSSWHGTHTAGTIGAATNNSIGVAGINWTSKILPVRVLGKCGGFTSDIVDGMRWAAGLSVTGVPANPNPAKVLNLSLGGSGACSATWQSAVNDVVAAGVTVVVSAGNSNANASGFSPASCTGVICVAATGRTGGRAYYSNFGTIVKIAAPGGDQSSGTANGVLSTLNTGTTTPVISPFGDTYVYYQGTSMAAPHVTGIVSLMLSANPALTPAQVLARLQATARTFPTGTVSDCTTSICGAGIVDAAAAIETLMPAISSLSPSSTTAGDASFTLTVNGNNFVSGSVVRWNGANRTTTFVSITQLTAVISADDIATGAVVPVTVFSPAPGGGTSSSLNFTVNNPVPAISFINPSFKTPGDTGFTLTVNGSNFVSNSVVQWNGISRMTTFISTTELTATILAADIATKGDASVTAFNPTPGGGTSTSKNFSIQQIFAGGGGGGGGGCFIATAAFGTPMERHVQILRDFRDRYLLKTSAGQALVKFYYEISPPIAGKIAQNEGLRFITRCSLMPFVGMAYLMVTYGLAATSLFAFSFILLIGALVWTIRRKMVFANQ